MKILGISSATRYISVGLCENNILINESTFWGPMASVENLITQIDLVTEKKKIDFDAIAVASGPGGYNGLRGSITTAKTIAKVLEKKLIEISTLEGVAYNLRAVRGSILAITDARLNEHNVALFSANGMTISRLSDDLLMTTEKIEELLKKISGQIYIASYDKETGERLALMKNDNCIIVDPALAIPTGGNIALLGQNKTGVKNIYSVTPRYSVEPNIREFKQP